MKKEFPARLHILLASESDKAIVIRRGPAKEVCTFLWDRKDDSFHMGQWLKGRIYEKRCDISPNGDFFIYFAFRGSRQEDGLYAWTAISHAPYLKAIECYSKDDCYEGGGLFLSKNTFWLNDSYFDHEKQVQSSSKVTRNSTYNPHEIYGYHGSECTGIYYIRLQRDGWELKEVQEHTSKNKGTITIFEKELTKGWILRKLCHQGGNTPEGKSVYWDEHKLINIKSNTTINCPDWEWAEKDKHSVVYAKKGLLFRVSIKNADELNEPKCLFNFNGSKFEAIEAPY